MFPATAGEGLPPPADFGYPPQDLHDSSFQASMLNMPGGPLSSAVDGLDMPEGVHAAGDIDGYDQAGGQNGGPDDVSRQRERNR